jgi:hypothetical protein
VTVARSRGADLNAHPADKPNPPPAPPRSSPRAAPLRSLGACAGTGSSSQGSAHRPRNLRICVGYGVLLPDLGDAVELGRALAYTNSAFMESGDLREDHVCAPPPPSQALRLDDLLQPLLRNLGPRLAWPVWRQR